MDLKKYLFSSTKMGQLLLKLAMCQSETKLGYSILYRYIFLKIKD